MTVSSDAASEIYRYFLDGGACSAPPTEAIEARIRAQLPLLGARDLHELVDKVRRRFDGLGPLEELLADPATTEVMVNAGMVWREHQGVVQRTGIRLDDAAVGRLIDRLVGFGGVRVDRASPMVDVRLADGSRANVVVPPVAIDGPVITIRRFTLRRATLADFCPPEQAEVLAAAVRGRRGIIVFGGTGAGKTTLLNALASEVPSTERLVTIEDTAELRLEHPHVVRLEARRPNSEGAGGVTVGELVRNSLRMRPDRIVVGECRGPEVLDMVQAMNSGHAGSLSTCHANSPRDALRRLEAMALMGGELPLSFVRSQLAAAVGVLVEVGRTSGGGRAVRAINGVRGEADWGSGEGLVDLLAATR